MAGVDLSSRMIDKAEARGIYNELQCGDVIEALKRDTPAWDLLLAADVLVYIGDLGDFMPAAASALRAGGWLLFSVEKSTQSGFVLGKAGRRNRHDHNGCRGDRAAARLRERCHGLSANDAETMIYNKVQAFIYPIPPVVELIVIQN